MVKFENVEIRYGDFVAINDLNLEIKEGEFFTFLGPSGCGKTTSLRALVGFITPSKGKVIVAGKDVMLESGRIDHSESDRNSQFELNRNSQCTLAN